jgi:oxygen-dependent protoporphyrinogen oxidase
LGELFVKKGYGLEESVWDFFRRRFGVHVADRIVSPFVSGIWAGNAKLLSIQSAFPQLIEWEKQYGSVIKGLFKSRNKKAPQKIKGLISFQDGIETLALGLSQRLKTNLLTNTTAVDLQRTSTNTWQITTNNRETLSAKNIVFTSYTYESADLLKPLFPAVANALKNIPYAPIKVLHLGFKRENIEHPLDGFGYLTCPSESKNILGCLWSSSLFPGRTPPNSVLITVFLGGMTNKEIIEKNDTEVLDLALNDISKTLGIKASPFFTNIATYGKAIPQYTIGHRERLNTILNLQQTNPGLWFSGNYMEGISVGEVIKNALKVADQLQKSARD